MSLDHMEVNNRPNPSATGRATEQTAANFLRTYGWHIFMPSCNSHSPADILAVRGSTVILVQVKTSVQSLSKCAASRLRAMADQIRAVPLFCTRSKSTRYLQWYLVDEQLEMVPIHIRHAISLHPVPNKVDERAVQS